MNHERSTIVYVSKKVLAFLILYGVSAIIGEVIIIGGLSIAGYNPLHGVMPTGQIGDLIPYYGFSIFLLSAIIYCRFIEKRSINSMGFNKRIGDFFVGAGIAIVLLIIILGLCCVCGGISYVGISENVDYIYLFALLCGLLIQGTAEEALCRGFLMHSLIHKISHKSAILISATAFVLPHFTSLMEVEISFVIIGTVNLYLISITFSLLMLYRVNIWISCGLHCIWNFLLYGVFGLTLSGGVANTEGILCFKANVSSVLNGDEYGIEASIVTTIVLGAAVFILLRYWGERDGI